MPRWLARTKRTRCSSSGKGGSSLSIRRKRVGDGKPLAEEDFVGLAQASLRGVRDAVPFKTDLVDGARLGGVAVHDHEGRHVLHDLRAAADHGEFADAAKLVHGGQTADDGVILDRTCPASVATLDMMT